VPQDFTIPGRAGQSNFAFGGNTVSRFNDIISQLSSDQNMISFAQGLENTHIRGKNWH
jgi:hypothetical protein